MTKDTASEIHAGMRFLGELVDKLEGSIELAKANAMAYASKIGGTHEDYKSYLIGALEGTIISAKIELKSTIEFMQTPWEQQIEEDPPVTIQEVA